MHQATTVSTSSGVTSSVSGPFFFPVPEQRVYAAAPVRYGRASPGYGLRGPAGGHSRNGGMKVQSRAPRQSKSKRAAFAALRYLSMRLSEIFVGFFCTRTVTVNHEVRCGILVIQQQLTHFFFSISFAAAGLSFSQEIAFALPWPILSPL